MITCSDHDFSGNLICIIVLSKNRNSLDLKPSFTNLLIGLVGRPFILNKLAWLIKWRGRKTYSFIKLDCECRACRTYIEILANFSQIQTALQIIGDSSTNFSK